MEKPLFVRLAEHTDSPQIAALLQRSITVLCVMDHNNDPAILARWAGTKTTAFIDAWLNDPSHRMFVGQAGDQLVCVGGLSDAGEITLNYVDPAFRFQGASRKMITGLETQARASGLACCYLMATKTARRFYESMGYQFVQEEAGFFGKPVFRMEKEI